MPTKNWKNTYSAPSSKRKLSISSSPLSSMSSTSSTRHRLKRAAEEAVVKECQPQDVAIYNTSTCLLKLSGEIRNHIYGLCEETRPIYLKIVHRHQTSSLANQQRKYFSLTQVCQQIRSEFRPIYFKKTENWISLGCFEWFEADFLRPVPLNAIIKIDIRVPLRHSNLSVDILPIIKFCKANPNLDIKFAHRAPMSRWNSFQDVTTEGLNVLFVEDKADYPHWKSFLEQATTHVIFAITGHWAPQLTFFIKPDMAPKQPNPGRSLANVYDMECPPVSEIIGMVVHDEPMEGLR